LGGEPRFDGFKALNQLSLTINVGELRCIIGPNGAGKTTMMDCITGKTKPDSGKVFFGSNIDLLRLKEPEIAQIGVGRKFQKPTVYEQLTVFENLRCAVLWSLGYKYSFWKFLSGLKDANERTDELLDMIHLDKKRDVLAVNLTYAEQRALEIGVTIAGGSQVILLDEPTAGMSKSETSRFIQLIKDVTVGKTLLTVEHDMGVVFGLADKIAVVVYGEVIAFDTPEAVRANAKVQEAYLGSPVADNQAGGH
jgi:branched-chain amino acid transport system ATP-binding protein